MFLIYNVLSCSFLYRDRLEREAGNDPDKEDSDDDVMMNNPFQPIGKHLVSEIHLFDYQTMEWVKLHIQGLQLGRINR